MTDARWEQVKELLHQVIRDYCDAVCRRFQSSASSLTATASASRADVAL